MLETPSMHLQHPEPANHTAQDQVIAPITCVICQASYTPSDLHQHFLQDSPLVLESAYMSMCHYCFRCRRPACPECWDSIHGICGACVQEANLPFRTQVKPLDGILLPPISPTSPPEAIQENTTSSQFVCVKHGKFHTQAASSHALSPTETVPPIESTTQPPELLPYIAQVQELPTPPETHSDSYMVGAGLALALESPSASALESPLAPARDTASALETAPTKRRRSTMKKVRLVLTGIVLLALLAIAVMIALAEYSMKANTFIDHLLHIDIRAEITYLLHLVQQHL